MLNFKSLFDTCLHYWPIIATIVIVITSLIIKKYIVKLQETNKRRENHHKDIKEKVLNPIIRNISNVLRFIEIKDSPDGERLLSEENEHTLFEAYKNRYPKLTRDTVKHFLECAESRHYRKLFSVIRETETFLEENLQEWGKKFETLKREIGKRAQNHYQKLDEKLMGEKVASVLLFLDGYDANGSYLLKAEKRNKTLEYVSQIAKELQEQNESMLKEEQLLRGQINQKMQELLCKIQELVDSQIPLRGKCRFL